MKRGYSFKRLLYIFLSNNSNEIISDEKRKKISLRLSTTLIEL